jgi:hypothetical protein
MCLFSLLFAMNNEIEYNNQVDGKIERKTQYFLLYKVKIGCLVSNIVPIIEWFLLGTEKFGWVPVPQAKFI